MSRLTTDKESACKACGGRHYARGLCKKHYMRSLRVSHGVPVRAPCTNEDCGRSTSSGGLCCRCRVRANTGLPLNVSHRPTGEKHRLWKGGKTILYSNSGRARSRAYKLIATGWKCEECGESAKVVTPKDGNVSNISVENMLVVCWKCLGLLRRKHHERPTRRG